MTSQINEYFTLCKHMTLQTNMCTFSINEYFTLCKHMTLHIYIHEIHLRFGYVNNADYSQGQLEVHMNYIIIIKVWVYELQLQSQGQLDF